MRIPLNDLHLSNTGILSEIKSALNRVLNSGQYILAHEVEAFEREFADYCGTHHCIGLANGTDALELALHALEIKPKDQVITIANAGGYSTAAIYNVGALPFYIDVDPLSMTLNPEELKTNITSETKAIVVTHLYGQIADMEKICRISQEKKIPVIEDCAQAHGAVLNGKKAGSWGALGCFSFYPTKNLGALGDSGAIVTHDSELANRIRKLRQYGWENKYHVSLLNGRNSRLDELQAAILRVKLLYLDEWNQQRREIAHHYNQAFIDLGFITPQNPDASSVAHLYVIRTPQRNELHKRLKIKNITTEIHYPIPDHFQSGFEHFAKTNLSVTEQCCANVLTLPCFPQMTEANINYVIESVQETIKETRAAHESF